jgi:hypothetical protein
MSNILFNLELLFPVRAGRGELRGPKGCLRKVTTGWAYDLAAAQAEVARMVAACTYGTPVEARYYAGADWRADCLTAQPILRVSL